jgi:hypothetical protein
VTYELHREVFRVVEWRDDSVFRTECVEVGWFDEATVRANHPSISGLIYACVSNDLTPGIRRKRE